MASQTKFLIFLAAVFFLLSSQSFAEDIMTVTVSGKSKERSQSAARKDVFEQVINDLSEQYIVEFIGIEKFQRNKEVIESKIIKNSNKYVLFMKGSNFKAGPLESTMDVELKVSLESLKQMLLGEGLLYKTEGAPKVLPLVTYSDRVNAQAYSWWVKPTLKSNRYLGSWARGFHSNLEAQLKALGFFGMTPMYGKYEKMVPKVFKTESPRTEDFLFLGQFFNAEIVLRGHIRFSRMREKNDTFRIDIDLTALQVANGRVIGQTERTYETKPGEFIATTGQKIAWLNTIVSKDLSKQLHQAWKRGTFGSSLLKLTVLGETQYPTLQNFKKEVTSKVKEVRSLKERLFGPDSTVYELNTSVGSQKMAELLQGATFENMALKVEEVNDSNIEVRIETK